MARVRAVGARQCDVGRHLLLVRHAKSSWDDLGLADHDRPLALRGVRALPRLREHLDRSGLRPDLVLCSSARRTVETLDGIRPVLGDRVLIEVDPEIYEMDDDDLLARLRTLGVGCAMAIGHNPCTQELATGLAGSGDPDTLQQLEAKLPTAAAVTLSFDGSWADLGPGTARVDDLFMPRPPRT